MTDLPAPVSASDVFRLITEVFGDAYRPRRLVAHSEERAIFAAWDVVLKRTVALRVHLVPETPGREWFLRESEVLARLDYTAIRRIYAAGFRNRYAYRIANWVEGESLLEAVARGPRPIPDVLTLMRDLASALVHAHGRSVMLRRIAPAAIIVDQSGHGTITDLRFANDCLGVAVEPDSEDVAFLAPEVRGGRRGDPAADVYGVAASIYFALTREAPSLDPAKTVPARERRAVVPEAIDRILMRALQPNPADRHLTASEFLDELQRAAGDWDSPAVPPVELLDTGGNPAVPRWEARLRRALGDDYELLGELGRGAAGRVYQVRDLRLEREVALKVLHPALTSDPALVERFRREAQLAARLQHPNIVDVFDIDTRLGLFWYTMELVRGPSLAGLIQRDGPLTVSRTLRLLDECLSALEHAHGFGLIHRDIKPENLLMAPNGQVLVSDFGLALALEGDTRFSGASSHSGTPQFAAPEQLLGEHVDRRADLYSLSLVAYFALLGAPPFDADTPTAIISRQMSGSFPSLGRTRQDVPPAVEATLRKAADPDPARRYASAAEFRLALRRARS